MLPIYLSPSLSVHTLPLIFANWRRGQKNPKHRPKVTGKNNRLALKVSSVVPHVEEQSGWLGKAGLDWQAAGEAAEFSLSK